jgi:folate-dependent phosphoribosylglycinamide formyltransferase PurN
MSRGHAMNKAQNKKKLKILILSGEDFWLTPMVVRQLRRFDLEVTYVRVKSFGRESAKGFKILASLSTKHIITVLLSVAVNIFFFSFNSRLVKKFDFSTLNLFDYTFLVNYPYKVVMDHYPDTLFNCHPSMLPNYSGLQPIPRMFKENSDECLGATIHQLDRTIDTGPIIFQKNVNAPNVYDAYIRTYSTFVEGINTIIQTSDSE